MINIICYVFGHNFECTFSITLKNNTKKDLITFCNRCCKEIDFTKYYQKFHEKMEKNQHDS